MKLYLKKELLPLANGEASELLGRIESLEGEVESLTKEVEFLSSRWQSAYNDAYLLGSRLADGRYEFKDQAELQQRLADYKARLERVEEQLNGKKADLKTLQTDLSGLRESFNSRYVAMEAEELI